MDSIAELLEEELQDLYSAENQLLKMMPRIAKRIDSDTLRKAFEMHRKQTEGQVTRLERAAKELGIKPKGKTCAAMKGLLEEAKEILSENKGSSPLIDAALIGASQRIEHYEISGYGTARTLAQAMGEDKVAQLLQQTLEEEKATDVKLTEVAEGEVLPAAQSAGGEEEEED